MKSRSIPSFLYVNTLFKTIEYKLDSKSNLHITQLSMSGHHKRAISLDAIKLSNVEQLTGTTSTLINRISTYFSFKKPVEKYTYINSSTDEYLFSLRKYKHNENEIEDFVSRLNLNIKKAKNTEPLDANSVNYAEEQSSIYITHLDALYNSGIIGDVIYKRISTSIYEKAVGNNEYKPLADVIYLPLS